MSSNTVPHPRRQPYLWVAHPRTSTSQPGMPSLLTPCPQLSSFLTTSCYLRLLSTRTMKGVNWWQTATPLLPPQVMLDHFLLCQTADRSLQQKLQSVSSTYFLAHSRWPNLFFGRLVSPRPPPASSALLLGFDPGGSDRSVPARRRAAPSSSLGAAGWGASPPSIFISARHNL